MSQVFDVDGWNNFCRVFELPKHLPDYCEEDDGVDTNFNMVCFFRPLDVDVLGSGHFFTKNDWLREGGEIIVIKKHIDDLKNDAYARFCNSPWSKSGIKYLYIYDFGLTFLFEKDM